MILEGYYYSTCLLTIEVLQRPQDLADGSRPVVDDCIGKSRSGARANVCIFMFCENGQLSARSGHEC